MLHINFDNKGAALKILCLGAHADDIEIGCGGTILKLIETYSNIEIKWIVFSSGEVRKIEALQCANQFLDKVEKSDVDILSFKDGFFPYIGEEIKNYFFFFKQKTAYEIYQCDWSSDVCSSDLEQDIIFFF